MENTSNDMSQSSDLNDALDKATLSLEKTKAALEEAMRRYPDDHAGLSWFAQASGLASGAIIQEHLDWANRVISDKIRSSIK